MTLNGKSGSHGVPAELADQLRTARRNCVQDIANMDARHRARRTAQLFVTCQRECNHRSADAVFHSARNQSDDTLMPCLVEKADPTAVKRMRTRVAQLTHSVQRICLHTRFNGSAFEVELV